MTSSSPVSTQSEENDDWQYGPRPAKRRRATPASTPRPSPREIGFMRESHDDGSATFLGSSSGIYFIRHVYSAFARRSAHLQQTRDRDRASVPGEDDRLRSSGTANVTDELWSREELNYAPTSAFSFEDLINWTRRYFENWHPVFPCLHAPSVLKIMERLSSQGTASVGLPEMMVIRSIVSISLADSRQVAAIQSKIGPVPATLVYRTVHRVLQDIQSLLAEPTTLPLLQAAFTAQLALVSLLRLNAASRVGGVITRTAFHLGLHRCPGRFPCFSNEDVDIRRRLFWSIYILERYLSQALGIPLTIRDDDIDVCYPGEESHTSPSTNPAGDHRLQLLNNLAKHARIRGLILELRNKSIPHTHAGSVEASHVNSELSQWWNEVYDDVNPIADLDPAPGKEPVLSPYHRLLLTILRHEAIISMNRSLLVAEKSSPDYKNALQTCIASSRSLLAGLKRYMSATSDAPLTWPSFTWITWMACLVLMYAAWEGDFPIATTLKYAQISISVLDNLALRGSSWPETCIEAIKSMESALATKDSGHQMRSPNDSNNSPRSKTFSAPRRIERLNGSSEQTVRCQPPGTTRTPTLRDQQRQTACQQSASAPGLEPPRFFADTRGPNSRQPEDSMVSSSPSNVHEPNLSSHDGYQLNGPTSADLIFGNMINSTAPFGGWDSVAFSDPSLALGDSWSVADGPWMIHGNFL